MKLLDTGSGNTKIAKTNKYNQTIRVASLSMMPDEILCPASKAAGCRSTCLEAQGRGRFDNVKRARQAKTDWFHADRKGFLAQLHKELDNFAALCKKQEVKPVVRLNVLSDIQWEKLNIPQNHPDITFYDYTKLAARLDKTPPNYLLMFSYSGRAEYRSQVERAGSSGAPIVTVFKATIPKFFMGKRVVAGDADDWANAQLRDVVIGLTAKGSARHDTSGFVVDADNLIAMGG